MFMREICEELFVNIIARVSDVGWLLKRTVNEQVGPPPMV